MDSFSWRDSGVAVPRFDQHQSGWCGACYLVATAQVAVDRYRKLHLERRGSLPSTVLDLQALLNDFDVYQKAKEESSWTACQGGVSEDVAQCLIDGACQVSLRRARAWRGFVTLGRSRRREGAPAPPFRVTRHYRVEPADVRREIRARGPVGLDIDGDLLLTASDGVVPEASAQDPRFGDENHCVACVGWTETHWVLRNSWGRALPAQRACPRYACAASSSSPSTPWDSPDGYCYLPFSYAPLHYEGAASPWYALRVELA